MSILVWVRDKLFGKPAPVESKVETIVNPQITDAVTQTAPPAADKTTKAKKSAAKTKKSK